MSFSNQQSASSGAESSGLIDSPFFSGDFSVAWAAGNASTGSREGQHAQADASGVLDLSMSKGALLIAGLVLVGAVLWKLSR
jgi:hypothetical protein